MSTFQRSVSVRVIGHSILPPSSLYPSLFVYLYEHARYRAATFSFNCRSAQRVVTTLWSDWWTDVLKIDSCSNRRFHTASLKLSLLSTVNSEKEMLFNWIKYFAWEISELHEIVKLHDYFANYIILYYSCLQVAVLMLFHSSICKKCFPLWQLNYTWLHIES